MENKTNYELENGRKIHIESLNQYGTYSGSGLWEGVPTQRMNEDILGDPMYDPDHKTYVSDNAFIDHSGGYVIKPKDVYWSSKEDYARRGAPPSIPGITCIANFKSSFDEVPRDSDEAYSSMTIKWFQNRFAFPIEESVLEHILSIDWDKHANITLADDL